MIEVSLVERIPSVEEYLTLRKAIKWKIVDKESCEKGLQGSLYCVCAELYDELIGMARVIGDSGLYFYIQDVIVLPQYQKMGTGRLLMEKVMNFLENNLSPLTVVGLMASKGKEPFYEKFGFTKRPSERRGHGMFRIWD
ncbi:MAG: GNAT family N-acetyltransferase [Promethearchaeota archaeon]|jgi:predicted GNAT family N-acyltransferase